MRSPKTTTPKGRMRKPKEQQPATRQRAGQPSVRREILEGLREMAEFASSGEPPKKRYTVRHLTLDLDPGDYTPDKVRATREVFGLSQPLFAKFLGVEVSAAGGALGAGHSPAVGGGPPVPRRDERHSRPLVGTDRGGGEENAEGSDRKEVVNSGGGKRLKPHGHEVGL